MKGWLGRHQAEMASQGKDSMNKGPRVVQPGALWGLVYS